MHAHQARRKYRAYAFRRADARCGHPLTIRSLLKRPSTRNRTKFIYAFIYARFTFFIQRPPIARVATRR